MSKGFTTAADAEDAYYDAIDECDLEKMMSVWADSSQTTCLMPMQPLHHGKESIRELWKMMLNSQHRVEITINHLQWIEQGDIAIHTLEEMVTLSGIAEQQPPIYATNIYHRTNGWHMLMHINSPAPPPPGMMPPNMPM